MRPQPAPVPRLGRREIFADTHFWLALTLAGDPWHEKAHRMREALSRARFTTTEAVLTEFLNFVSDYGPAVRTSMADFTGALRSDPDVEIIPVADGLFDAGLDLYKHRPDKEYSLTDCFSMVAMRTRRIYEVLTHDHHFAQEGFEVLLR